MIIFENTPYREDKNLIEAYNSFMELLPEDGWALFRDADTLFLDPFYGEIISRAIQNNEDAGCFTCLTNRIGNKVQLHNEYEGDDIKKHREIAEKIKQKNYNTYDLFNFDVDSGSTLSGMLMVLSKKAWKEIGGFKRSTITSASPRKRSSNSNILGVDNQLHKDLHANGIELKIIKEMYIYHWYRGGGTDKDHLKPNTKYEHNKNNKSVKKSSGSNAKKFVENRHRRKKR